MSRKSSRKDISADFEKLNITLGIESEAKLGNLVSLFQSKILSAIKIVIDKKKRRILSRFMTLYRGHKC